MTLLTPEEMRALEARAPNREALATMADAALVDKKFLNDTAVRRAMCWVADLHPIDRYTPGRRKIYTVFIHCSATDGNPIVLPQA